MRFNRRIAIGLLIAVAALGAGIAWYALLQRSAAPAATFRTLDGRNVGLKELHGKIVAVKFWATSCSICVEEMPDIVQLYGDYRSRSFELIAVAMAYDPPEQVRSFTRSRGLPFPVVLDTGGDIARSFNDTRVVPTTFVIDREGKLVSQTLGKIDISKFREYLDASLRK